MSDEPYVLPYAPEDPRGPMLRLVAGWEREYLNAEGDHWGEKVAWGTAKDIADRLDTAIQTKIDSLRQCRTDDDRLAAALPTEEALERVIVVISRGDLNRLDEIAGFFDQIGGFCLSTMADDSWNLRNAMVPFQPGDPLHIDDDGNREGDHAQG